jgi:hypothetical protein
MADEVCASDALLIKHTHLGKALVKKHSTLVFQFFAGLTLLPVAYF